MRSIPVDSPRDQEHQMTTHAVFNGVGFAAHDPDIWYPVGQSLGTRATAWRSRFATTGFLVEPDADGNDRVINFESRIEKYAIEALAMDPSIATVIEQAPCVEYYDHNGEWHRHTFDCLAIGTDGLRTAGAIKHSKRAAKSGIYETVRSIAAQIDRSIADRVVVMTELDFSSAERANAELVHEVRRHPVPAHDALVRGVVAEIIGSVTVRTIADASGLPAADGFRAVVRALADGVLRLSSPGSRIDHETRVRRA
ncbi:hypothetical protein E0H22_15645 [Rhodopseudomonas boonkerdii]|uniref:hypothetical protein n=1 Tax=Rhodopseudomonas boonkerdii TaxID=475937 RepID=UPI001E46A338|nr:hypothetical protein [Rhodopseudomonas boonkerdii]UGV26996.1 hypothetical protein E0H22_15645 [Rhodopseudomonas boonkerdii]